MRLCLAPVGALLLAPIAALAVAGDSAQALRPTSLFSISTANGPTM